MRNISGLRPYQKGQSGNPGGKPKIPDNLRQICSLSQLEVCKLVSKYARMTREELQASLSDTKTPMVEITIASIFAQSAKNGDYQRFSFLLDRAVGKADSLAPHDEIRDTLEAMSREQLIERLEADLAILKTA